MTLGNKKGRPEKEKKLESTSIRLDETILEDIDYIRDTLISVNKIQITRAQVVRMIVTEHIKDHVAEIESLYPQYSRGSYTVIDNKSTNDTSG